MSIPRSRRQHARNQSLPREDGSGNEATITPNIERSSKPKREVGELKQILIQVRGKITPLLQNLKKPGKHPSGWLADSRAIGVKNLIAKVDSRLVANQINGSYEAKEQSMTQYLEKAKTLINNFKMFSIEQVPRSENKKADALSKIASTSFAHLTKHVLVETLESKSLEEREILAIVEEEGYCWMTPLVEYLTE
ncbi:reverse transcriptase domain-containing protein, partial [Tanacetum coccineum]